MLLQIAREHGATPRQVALRFLLRSPNVFTIPKAPDAAGIAAPCGGAETHVARTAR